MTHQSTRSRRNAWLNRIVVCFAVMLISPLANAIPLQWVLQDVTFDDGGVASGSFVFDADTGTYSSISITTTDGTALPGSFYEYMNFEAGLLDADSVLLVAAENPTTGTPAFNMNLDNAMTNAGGTISLAMGSPPIAYESTCLISNCSAFFSIDRSIISGTITTVPVPPAIWLFGSAVGWLGWRAKASTL